MTMYSKFMFCSFYSLAVIVNGFNTVFRTFNDITLKTPYRVVEAVRRTVSGVPSRNSHTLLFAKICESPINRIPL